MCDNEEPIGFIIRDTDHYMSKHNMKVTMVNRLYMFEGTALHYAKLWYGDAGSVYAVFLSGCVRVVK